VVEVTTPFGVREFDLTAATDPEQCIQVPKGTNGMPFPGIHYGPSITAISSTPPRFLIAYTGVDPTTNFEIINVYMVTLKTAGGYAGPHEIELVARLDDSASGSHLLFPDLIQPDHLAGSDLGVDTPVILRFASVSGDTVGEHAIALYSGLAGPRHDLATWSLAAAYPSPVVCDDDSTDFECFIGDYRYGALIEKTGGTSRFFMPWIGGDPAGATPGTSVQGAVFDVSP
jgi:hypothetical protein